MVSYELIKAYEVLYRCGDSVGVREFQRLMRYNSPGKAKRVLERLVREGLARTVDGGGYVAVKVLPPKLASYIVIRGKVMPRTLIYAAFSASFIASFVALAKPPAILAVALAVLSLPYWVEAAYLMVMLKRLGRG
jgi:hypothetical protein